MSLRRVLAAVVAVVLVLAVFVAGVVVGGHAEAVGLNRLKDPLRGWVLGDSGQDLSGQVLDLLEDRYYEPIDRQRLQDASVDALIAKRESRADRAVVELDALPDTNRTRPQDDDFRPFERGRLVL